GFGHCALQTEVVGYLVLEDELGGLLGAEALPDPEEQPLAHLLANRNTRGKPPLALRLNLELVQLERVGNRSCEARGQIAAGQGAGTLGQRNLLPLAQLVDRHVEDDERQDVGLIERWIAREGQLGLADAALH